MTVENAGATIPLTAPDHPSFAEMTAVFTRIGLLSGGGPAGQIALMHKVLVEEKRWISETRFLHALNYCTLLPGPEAQQLATYIGWLLHGTKGGVVAGTLFVIPGFLVILALSASYALFQQTDILTSLFYGIKAAVLAIVIEAVLRVSRRALRNAVMIALAALAFIALFFFAVPFPLVVLTAGIVGYIGARQRPDLFAASGHGGKAQAAIGPAVIDDNVPEVDPSWRRAVRVVAIWGSLWVLPWILVGLVFGWGSSFASIYVFFSQMAAPMPCSPMSRRKPSSPLAGCSRGR